MNELYSNGYRGLLVGGAILLWMWALMGGVRSSDTITTSRPAATKPVSATPASQGQPPPARDSSFEEVALLVIESPRRRMAQPTPEAATLTPTVLVNPATYPVWFESERAVGICKIIWEGKSMTANLRASARLPEGTHVFSYTCGKRRGRASIDVEPTRVNGVLFCDNAGDVAVDTVRRDDSRCKHS